LENLNNYKLMGKYRKYEELEQELAKVQAKWEKEVRDLNSKNFEELEELSMLNDKILSDKENDINNVSNKKKYISFTYLNK